MTSTIDHIFNNVLDLDKNNIKKKIFRPWLCAMDEENQAKHQNQQNLTNQLNQQNQNVFNLEKINKSINNNQNLFNCNLLNLNSFFEKQIN